MTEHSLSTLYRQMCKKQHTASLDLLDADTLVAAAAGTLRGDRRDEVASRLARSPLQTDLVRMLGELAPASASLAAAIGERHVREHSRGSRRVRHGNGEQPRARPLRWAGLAACMMLIFGAVLWLPQGNDPMPGTARTEAMPDRIFTSKDRIFAMVETSPVSASADGVFRSDFNDG